MIKHATVATIEREASSTNTVIALGGSVAAEVSLMPERKPDLHLVDFHTVLGAPAQVGNETVVRYSWLA